MCLRIFDRFVKYRQVFFIYCVGYLNDPYCPLRSITFKAGTSRGRDPVQFCQLNNTVLYASAHHRLHSVKYITPFIFPPRTRIRVVYSFSLVFVGIPKNQVGGQSSCVSAPVFSLSPGTCGTFVTGAAAVATNISVGLGIVSVALSAFAMDPVEATFDCLG